MVFKTNYRLVLVKSITEWSILQYFRPSLTYKLSLRSLFCLFLSGRFTQVLLYFFIKGNSLPGPRKLTDEISGFEKYIENDIKERGEENAMVANERAPLDSSAEDLKLLRILQNVLDTDVQTGDKRWV